MTTFPTRTDTPPGWTGPLPDVSVRLIKVGLVAVAAAAIGSVLFLAASHLQDRYGVLHVQGAWMGLAQYANEGVLYPPLFDGEHYGGTRWMPLPILLNAGAAQITGEYLVSGKLVGVLTMALLVVLVFVSIRRLRAPSPLSAALAGTIVATDPGRMAATTLGGDVLPVVLQVGALMVAIRARKYALVIAGILAGLALASKTTGVWAALALITWFVLRQRWRDLAVFGGASAVTSAIVLSTVELISDGRFSDNLLVLTFAGVGGGVGPIRAPNQILYNLANFGLATWVLVPFGLLGVLTAHRLREISAYHLALGWGLLLLLVTYVDVGAGSNQLLDVTVLTVLAVGQLAGRLDFSRMRATPLAVVLGLVVIWGAGTGIVLDLVPDIRATVEGTPLGYPTRPLARRVGTMDEILSEDPYVPLSLGRQPTVLDPFMLRRLDRADPADVDRLIERIENKEFAYIVTIRRLHGAGGNSWVNDYWWDQFHFGLRVVTAMRNAYVLEGLVDDYYLYRPIS